AGRRRRARVTGVRVARRSGRLRHPDRAGHGPRRDRRGARARRPVPRHPEPGSVPLDLSPLAAALLDGACEETALDRWPTTSPHRGGHPMTAPFPQLPRQDVLPFPPTPSGSVAGRTMQESTYEPRATPRRLGDDAPNILVVLIDDAGPWLPSTFGGEVRTDTLTRVREQGISFNRFHTTAMCSPTRASLLTGRNHHRIGNGQIAELANDWDGYSGHIPSSTALVAEVLTDYGYATTAVGKWHNTPAEETTPAGPFHNWPTGKGFECFYGFLAGEASQYEPNLVRNTTSVRPPKRPEEGYHLSEDLADDAIHWLRQHQAFEPDKPFFMYWASGCLHGPHHIMKEWADRYAGAFDDGWDAYRE